MKSKKIDKTIRFNSEIQTLEKINPLFSRAKIRALYTGFNRNGSYFSKEAVEASLPSIYNIPIVGEYIEHADNFGDHGVSIEIKDNQIKLVSSTKPYGVVPESAEIYWENVTEENGTVNEYLVIDGAYLWTGRYEELDTLLEQPFGQSMEIEVVNGNFAVIDSIETFKVEEFLFSAFCILGIEKNGEGHVEPAFESADITAYSLDKEDFMKQFNQMIAELKFILEQGGNEMTKEKETETKEKVEEVFEQQEAEVIEGAETEEAEATEPKEADTTEALEEGVEEQEEAEETEQEEGTEATEPADLAQEFALTANQLRDQLRAQIGQHKYTDSWGDEWRKYWYVDHTDTEVIYENVQEGYQLYGAKYTLNGDNVTVDFDSAFKVKVEFVPFEGETLEFTTNIERFEVEKAEAQTEIDKLKAFKRQREEADLKAKFEGKLSDEEFEQVFTELKDTDLAQVEEKLFALIGKKNFSVQKSSNANINKVIITASSKDEDSDNPYGDIFED